MFWSRNTSAKQRQELLSAYIDNRLSEKELALMRRELERSAEWRADLEALRATIVRVQASPRVLPGRSFALTPSMVRTQPEKSVRSPLRPIMTFATAAAAMFLAVSVAGGAGLFGKSQPQISPPDGLRSAATVEQAAGDAEVGPAKAATRDSQFAPAATPSPSSMAPALSAAQATVSSQPTATVAPPAPTAPPAPSSTNAVRGPPAPSGPAGGSGPVGAAEHAAAPESSSDMPWLAFQMALGAATVIMAGYTLWLYQKPGPR